MIPEDIERAINAWYIYAADVRARDAQELATLRTLIARVVEQRDEARKALVYIDNTVHLTCDSVHHAKGNQNHNIAECPVVARVGKMIGAALGRMA